MQVSGSTAAAYRPLVAAYLKAYAEAEQADDLNRALVFNYIATSSRAVANEIQTTVQEPDLAREADRFASAAEAKDQVRAGLSIGRFFWKLVPGSALVAAGIAAVGFVLALLAEANRFGENVGVGLTGVVLSGGVIFFILRAAVVVAQGAAKAGEGLATFIGEAFASNEPAKRVVRALGPAEAQFLGQGPRLKRARRGRWVVDLTGPATGVALTFLIAIPLVLVAVALAGTVTGYQSSDGGWPGGYEYTLPDPEPGVLPE